MLRELRIRNLGVIDDVTLRLGPGLNVLTGETGAGKTMVVSAVQLLLGARGDADRVRAGAAVAIVEGSLAPVPPSASAWVDEDDEELIVAREVAAAGASSSRSRARIGGRMAPVSALGDCLSATIELHGQQDSSGLSSPAVQRELLDRFGGQRLAAAGQDYRAAFGRWAEARGELAALQASEQGRVREADRLRFELNEIEAVGPVAGEEGELRDELARLEHAEALRTAATAAAAAITGDGAAHDTLAGGASDLLHTAGVDPKLDALGERLASLVAECADVGLELRAYSESVESDPAGLEQRRGRFAELLRLTKKYGHAARGDLDTEGVLAYATQTRQRLEQLESGDWRSRQLAEAVTELESSLQAAAQRLRRERVAAGKRLAQTVERHLSDLAMHGAKLQVSVEPVPPAAHGADSVRFGLAPNAGEPVLPLGKSASGGERSRVALAVRLALADADRTPVLVFDEVDAGIGGATALAVGRKLAALARARQVLCVTHLPQLAAHADTHFSVAKGRSGDRTVAAVTELDGQTRVDELSRMLSGGDTPLAARHAAELLEQARAGAS